MVELTIGFKQAEVPAVANKQRQREQYRADPSNRYSLAECFAEFGECFAEIHECFAESCERFAESHKQFVGSW